MNTLDMEKTCDIGEDKPNIVYQKKVGCGEIYVIIVEHNNGNFDRLLIRGSMAKSCPCGESWLWAMADLLSYTLYHAFRNDSNNMERSIIRQLLAHSCNKVSLKTEVSCASAIGQCLKEYIKRKVSDAKK